MAFKDYDNYDALGLAALVRDKKVSAAELLDEAIARTEKVDPQINAVVVRVFPEEALVAPLLNVFPGFFVVVLQQAAGIYFIIRGAVPRYAQVV